MSDGICERVDMYYVEYVKSMKWVTGFGKLIRGSLQEADTIGRSAAITHKTSVAAENQQQSMQQLMQPLMMTASDQSFAPIQGSRVFSGLNIDQIMSGATSSVEAPSDLTSMLAAPTAAMVQLQGSPPPSSRGLQKSKDSKTNAASVKKAEDSKTKRKTNADIKQKGLILGGNWGGLTDKLVGIVDTALNKKDFPCLSNRLC